MTEKFMTDAYRIVYNDIVTNPDSNISPRTLAAVMDLVEYAETTDREYLALAQKFLDFAIHMGIEVPDGTDGLDLPGMIQALWDEQHIILKEAALEWGYERYHYAHGKRPQKRLEEWISGLDQDQIDTITNDYMTRRIR